MPTFRGLHNRANRCGTCVSVMLRPSFHPLDREKTPKKWEAGAEGHGPVHPELASGGSGPRGDGPGCVAARRAVAKRTDSEGWPQRAGGFGLPTIPRAARSPASRRALSLSGAGAVAGAGTGTGMVGTAGAGHRTRSHGTSSLQQRMPTTPD
jgi:hypothetical protein